MNTKKSLIYRRDFPLNSRLATSTLKMFFIFSQKAILYYFGFYYTRFISTDIRNRLSVSQ